MFSWLLFSSLTNPIFEFQIFFPYVTPRAIQICTLIRIWWDLRVYGKYAVIPRTLRIKSLYQNVECSFDECLCKAVSTWLLYCLAHLLAWPTEQGMGHSEWPMTHVAHDPWPIDPFPALMARRFCGEWLSNYCSFLWISSTSSYLLYQRRILFWNRVRRSYNWVRRTLSYFITVSWRSALILIVIVIHRVFGIEETADITLVC